MITTGTTVPLVKRFLLFVFAYLLLCAPSRAQEEQGENRSNPANVAPGQVQGLPAGAPVADRPDHEPGWAPPEAKSTPALKTEPTLKPEIKGDSVQKTVYLVVGGEKVFPIQVQLGPYTPELRAQSIKARINELETTEHFDPSLITTASGEYGTDIIYKDTIIATVTDIDAGVAGSKDRQKLAAEYASKLKSCVKKSIDDRSIPKLALRAGFSVAATIALLAFLALLAQFFNWLYLKIESWRGKYIRPLKFQKAVLLSGEAFTGALIGLCRLLRLFVVVVLVVSYLMLVLSFFPQTRTYSDDLISIILQPLTKVILPAILSYLPNVAFIATILIASYYIIGFTRFFFDEVGRETISFRGFDPEWAIPTFKIARFLLIAFALVLIFPYLPGAGSPAFQQVSLFLGILVSLGSSGAVAHVIAGVFLTYTGAFRLGDRVKISDTVGDVVERTLLATRIRTIKQEYITIPNGMVLNSHIVNYSISAKQSGLILHTTVTIGYEVPWPQVHKLLQEAASAAALILSEPPPFVLQTSLDDSYVSYELNAYTNSPHLMATIYSELHQRIQDKFNEAGVEIMSAHYAALRDGNRSTVPVSHLSKDYVKSKFDVSVERKE